MRLISDGGFGTTVWPLFTASDINTSTKETEAGLLAVYPTFYPNKYSIFLN
jgi:hypothetical protein